jgi:hypothetical protein
VQNREGKKYNGQVESHNCFRKLIDMIFPANRPEMAMQRSAAWSTAIISFLPDEIAVPLSDRLKIANEKCRPISDEELEAMQTYRTDQTSDDGPQMESRSVPTPIYKDGGLDSSRHVSCSYGPPGGPVRPKPAKPLAGYIQGLKLKVQVV